MNSLHETIDAAVRECETLRRALKRNDSVQVRSREERDLAKATVFAWFNNHLPPLRIAIGADSEDTVSKTYQTILSFTDRATSRAKYESELKNLKKSLAGLRKSVVKHSLSEIPGVSTDKAPDFSTLIGENAMQLVLRKRWDECVTCIHAGAPLAATVMMGGLLETLLLARVNTLSDKTKVFTAVSAPRDKTGKTIPLKEWTLRHYLDVVHELGLISKSAKNVGEILRDYRNYIHPYKQVSHDVTLGNNDARLFWEVSKEISRQLLSAAAV